MHIDDQIKYFKNFPILLALEPEAQRMLAFACNIQAYRAGDVLARQPKRSDGARLLTRGSVAWFDNDEQIGEPQQIMAAPALIGELAMIAPTDVSGSIVVREPSEAIFIPRETFNRVLQEFPRSAAAVQGLISARLGAFAQDLQKLATGRHPAFELPSCP